MLANLACRPGNNSERIRALGNLDRLVGGEVAEGLCGLACWPGDREPVTWVASSRPMVSTRLLPPKLELLPTVR